MRQQTLINLENVSFTYGCHPVLNDINLNIETGDAVGVVGPNGSGKTTLLKLIMGQLRPNCGNVKIYGVDAVRFKEKYKIGYVAQRAAHFNTQFPATVREVVASGRVAKRGIFRPLIRSDFKLVDEALSLVGLNELSQKPVGILSGGQQQRVFIARALAAEPEILILDEPTVGVDQAAQSSLYKLLRKLNQVKGMTLLIVSHELEGLSSIMTRQVCLDRHICTCQCHSYDVEKLLQEDPCSKRLIYQIAK